MGINLTPTKLDIWSSYLQFKNGLGGKDFFAFLTKRKDLAMSKLKLQDDPVARATWVLVDEIEDYIKLKEREMRQEQKDKDPI